jgi:hypothetical protein
MQQYLAAQIERQQQHYAVLKDVVDLHMLRQKGWQKRQELERPRRIIKRQDVEQLDWVAPTKVPACIIGNRGVQNARSTINQDGRHHGHNDNGSA